MQFLRIRFWKIFYRVFARCVWRSNVPVKTKYFGLKSVFCVPQITLYLSVHHLEHISLLLSTSASLLWPHKILSLSQSNQNIIIGRKRLGINYIHCDVYRVAKRRLFKCFECLVSAFPARICSQIVETRCR